MAHIQLLKRLHDTMCLKPKPKQIRRWEELLHGNDVMACSQQNLRNPVAAIHFFITSLSRQHQYRAGSVFSLSNYRRVHSTVETDWKRDFKITDHLLVACCLEC